jgi:hypothetical protein
MPNIAGASVEMARLASAALRDKGNFKFETFERVIFFELGR